MIPNSRVPTTTTTTTTATAITANTYTTIAATPDISRLPSSYTADYRAPFPHTSLPSQVQSKSRSRSGSQHHPHQWTSPIPQSSPSAMSKIPLQQPGLPHVPQDQKIRRKPLTPSGHNQDQNHNHNYNYNHNHNHNHNHNYDIGSNERYASRHVLEMPTYIDTPPAASPMDAATINDAQHVKPQKGALFGRFLRKLSKAAEDDILDDAPRVRPISMEAHVASRTVKNPHNIPLAPPPPPASQNKRRPVSATPPDNPKIPFDTFDDDDDAYYKRTSGLYRDKALPDISEARSRHVSPPPPAIHANSPRPISSSKSNTVCTTFNNNHQCSSNPTSPSIPPTPLPQTTMAPVEQKDVTQIVASNLQRRAQTVRVVHHHPPVSSRPPDLTLQARSIEQDDSGIGSPIDPMMSIQEETSDEDDDDEDDLFVDATESQDEVDRDRHESRLSKRLSGGHFGSAGGLILATTSKRHSKPPPEDIAKAMLNWKRQSGSSKRISGVSAVLRWNEDNNKEDDQDKEEELSQPDKAALREQAAETLMGGRLNRTTKSAEPDPTFVKTLDEAWRPTSPDLTHVRDPRIIDPSIQEQAQEAADKLWKEDNAFVERERIAEWLGQGKPLHREALVLYMKNFDFTNMRLDSAFRKLCSKLYFKAEAQQIDRILEVFAHRFWTCNRHTILKSPDVVYAVVYSVLLLNTDLHVAQGNYNRMTRQEFIRNTMAAVHDQTGPTVNRGWEADVETYLKELYTSVKQYQILQPMSTQQLASQQAQDSIPDRTSTLLNARRVVGLKRSVGSIIRRSGRESTFLVDEVLPRTSISSSTHPTSPRSPRRDSFSSIGSSTSFGRVRASSFSPGQPMMNFIDAHHPSLFTSRPPYVKEGIVMRKHLLETANQKAKHRDWKECLLVVDEGELKMYALTGSDSERRSMLRTSSQNSFANLAESLSSKSESLQGNGKWAAYSHLIGTIKLNHTLSNILPPPGYNRQRPHVFALQQPDGGVFLFQAASHDQTWEWMTTCNYWAARESKEPLPGGVSNMEYGWGALNHRGDPDTITIFDWRPPAPPLVPSTLSEKDQFLALQKHLQALDKEIDAHRELKPELMAKFPNKSQNHAKVMANWESKSKYLLHDIIKYQNYCGALEKSLEEQRQHQREAAETTPEIRLDYSETNVDLIKEIGDELQLAF